MKKILSKLILPNFIIMILCFIFVCIYYNAIDTSHTGPMHLWAILLIIVPFCILLILCGLCRVFKINITDSKKTSRFNKIIETISNIIAYIILSPVILVIVFVSMISNVINGDWKVFKHLKDKGFKKVVENKVYFYIRDNIIIHIPYSLNMYEISYDLGENYIDVTDSNLGTIEERNILKEKTLEFSNANPVDIQRGDVKPPLNEYVLFLCKYL